MICLITKQLRSPVIDLGCGNGPLTDHIADRGYMVTEIDDSEEMLQLAKKEHPELNFIKGNGFCFHLAEKADIVFQMRSSTGLVERISKLCCQISITA